ncbi:hypothetical protein ON010_g2697 [Phytophthora cinnamomi]|nr:hypothetical protein ON010_g2697 [Phytophthora cinnamomi]
MDCAGATDAAVPYLLGEGWSLSSESLHHREQCGGLQALVLATKQEGLQLDERLQAQERDYATTQKNAKKRVYKKRKCTHTVRKEERRALEAKIQVLHSKLEELKLQTLVQRGEQSEALYKRRAENMVLHDAVQDRHLAMAKMQAMLLGSTKRHSRSTLNALRKPKLHYARRFIEQRSQALHPTANYFQEERYETPEGDYCNVHFDRTPLRGVRGGIGAVFAAFKHAAFNAEIVFSENSDNVTIREDDGLADENFSQMRLVTQTTHGVLVESNIVHFSDFSHTEEKEIGNSYALATADYVDEDEQYPYRPNERVRRETTTIILVTVHASSGTAGCEGHTSLEEGEHVVVITRWTFTRVCRTDLDVPKQVLRRIARFGWSSLEVHPRLHLRVYRFTERLSHLS